MRFPELGTFQCLPRQKSFGGVWKGTADGQKSSSKAQAEELSVTMNLASGLLPSYPHQERLGPSEWSGERKGASQI